MHMHARLGLCLAALAYAAAPGAATVPTNAVMQVQFTIASVCNVAQATQADTPRVACLHNDPVNVAASKGQPLPATAAPDDSEITGGDSTSTSVQDVWIVTF